MWAKVLASRGMLAVSIFATVTLWLGFEGKLSSYIHPRYNLFTLAMAVLD
jgi:putative membrane protein